MHISCWLECAHTFSVGIFSLVGLHEWPPGREASSRLQWCGVMESAIIQIIIILIVTKSRPWTEHYTKHCLCPDAIHPPPQVHQLSTSPTPPHLLLRADIIKRINLSDISCRAFELYTTLGFKWNKSRIKSPQETFAEIWSLFEIASRFLWRRAFDNFQPICFFFMLLLLISCSVLFWYSCGSKSGIECLDR